MTRALEILGKYQRLIALAACAVVGLDIAVDELSLGDGVTTGLLLLAAALGIPQPRAVAQAMADARNPWAPKAVDPDAVTVPILLDEQPRP